ncbi:GAF domain-containing protein [Quadrisphaera sp. INWT6]|nr:GAF domain-containing protein [Quadrisphaera sp. INWT6]
MSWATEMISPRCSTRRTMALRRPRATADDVSEVQQARADVAAVTAVVQALSRATSVTTAVDSALAVVRDRFGWAYGSYWRVDTSGREPVLRFAQESGAVGDEFRKVTAEASFTRGTGLCGRAWAGEDVVFVPDLGEVTDCVRAPVAQRAGVRSATCLPVRAGDRVIGTMDFFTTDLLVMSPHRLDAPPGRLHPGLAGRRAPRRARGRRRDGQGRRGLQRRPARHERGQQRRAGAQPGAGHHPRGLRLELRLLLGGRPDRPPGPAALRAGVRQRR